MNLLSSLFIIEQISILGRSSLHLLTEWNNLNSSVFDGVGIGSFKTLVNRSLVWLTILFSFSVWHGRVGIC